MSSKQRGAGVAAPLGVCRAGLGATGLVLLGLGVAGCTTNGTPTASLATPRSGTVAFESIDGLPEPSFRKLVQDLTEEADTRQLAVVSREGPAQYRVRGYAAAHIRNKRTTTVAWVWDVYDAQQRRTLRISGEETGGGGRSGWAAADDQTLRRIARDGMGQLAVFLANPGTSEPTAPAPPPAAPGEPGYAVATNDDFSPEASGIFRFFKGLGPATAAAAPAPAATAAATAPAAQDPDADPVPLPKRRPRNAGLTTHAALAVEE